MKNEHVCDWLRDAHAMEKQAEGLFSGQADRLEDYTSLSGKLQEESRFAVQNQTLLSGLIDTLGSSTSGFKDAAAKFVAFEQNMTGAMTSDEPVKGVLALYTFSHMAVGSYQILVAAAETCAEVDVKTACETLLNTAERRAAWLAAELQPTTREFLARDARK